MATLGIVISRVTVKPPIFSVRFENKHAQTRLRQVTRACQTIVSRTDDNGVVSVRHNQDATTMLGVVKQSDVDYLVVDVVLAWRFQRGRANAF